MKKKGYIPFEEMSVPALKEIFDEEMIREGNATQQSIVDCEFTAQVVADLLDNYEAVASPLRFGVDKRSYN